MPNMDENAANSGDRLKHTLLLEVLSRCVNWNSLAYSETHAGAGTFNVGKQTQNGKQYIHDLEAAISHLAHTSELVGSGGSYISLLKSWWSDPTHKGVYPGSVIQAALFLKRCAKAADFYVTEACNDNFQRLEAATNSFGIKPENKPFQKQTILDWLCSGENIVMLIDPWGIIGKVSDPSKRDVILSNGKVDLDTLDDILTRLKAKQNAVIMLWTSFGQANRIHKSAVDEYLRNWSQMNDRTLRIFHDRKNHYVYLTGGGDGDRVVADVWPQKCISDCVVEL
jgi:hypothetical protein